MLFDWRKGTPVVSLEGVIAWLETLDPDAEYEFHDCNGGCLFSQYVLERHDMRKMPPHQMGHLYQEWVDLHHCFGNVAAKWPFTYGDALRRARKMRDKEFQVDDATDRDGFDDLRVTKAREPELV